MSFDLDLQFRESIEGTVGEIIENQTVLLGDRFFLEILLGDFRDNATGVISTSLEIEFEPAIIRNVDDPFNPSDLITEKMPILPTGDVDNETGLITNFGASSLPALENGGSGIGQNEFERFAILEFETVNVTDSSAIDVNVDLEQTGFADGQFPEPETESEFSIEFSVGGLTIDDTNFVVSEGIANGKVIGQVNIRNSLPNELEFEIINGNRDEDGDNISAFTVSQTGEIILSDRAELTDDFQLEIKVTDEALALEDTAQILVDVIPLPLFGTPEADIIETVTTREITFLGKGRDRATLSSTSSSHRLYGGTDDDLLFAGSSDRIFGNLGNDQFLVSAGGNNNRLYGGEGDDEFFLTSNNFVAGGDGIDRFFVGTEGDNILRGGSDPDFFWIFNGTLPNTANIIDDFTLGEDIIGLAGVEEAIRFTDLDLTQRDTDTVISFNQEIALLRGVEASQLSEDNFVFLQPTFSQPT